jgi:hypothetical protein
MDPQRPIFRSTVLQLADGESQYPLVAVTSTKRPTKAEQERRKSLQSGEKKKKRDDTFFTAFPERYNMEFHKAISTLRYCDGTSVSDTKHSYFNLYQSNGSNKFFELNDNGERLVRLSELLK